MKRPINTNSLPRVIDFLGVGKLNAIKQADLCNRLGCKPDELKDEIQRFRRKNSDPKLFICSSRNGYFLASDTTAS